MANHPMKQTILFRNLRISSLFQLFTYAQVFSNIDVAFDTLKHKAMDVAACKASIEELVQHIQSKKSDSAFDSVYQKAERLAQQPCKSLK